MNLRIQHMIAMMLLMAATAVWMGQASQDMTSPTSIQDGKVTQDKATKAPVAVKSSDLTRPQLPWSHYRVVAQRNIFTRRTSSGATGGDTTRPATGETTQPAKPAAAAWVLTGIVMQGDSSLAFFENTQTSQTLRVQAGQEVDDMLVQQVQLDRVIVRKADVSREVHVGQSIDGSQATLREASGDSIFGSSDGSASNPGASGAAGQGSNTNEQSIIERMRARRAKEGGR